MTLLFALFLIAAMLLVTIGVYSLVETKNLMRILMSVDLLTKAVTLVMIGAGHMNGKMGAAQAYVITIVVIEVVVLVVATGIVFGVYRHNGTLDTDKLNNLKG